MPEFDEVIETLNEQYDDPQKRVAAAIKNKSFASWCVEQAFKDYAIRMRQMRRHQMKRTNLFVRALTGAPPPKPRRSGVQEMALSAALADHMLQGALEMFADWKIGELSIGKAYWSDLDREEQSERARGSGHLLNAEILARLKAPMPSDDSKTVSQFYKRVQVEELVDAVRAEMRTKKVKSPRRKSVSKDDSIGVSP